MKDIRKSEGDIDFNDPLKCVKCGGWAEPTDTLSMMEVKVRGWICPKCNETYIHPGDAQAILAWNKYKHQKMTTRVGISGNGYVLRLPKDFAHSLGLAKGDKLSLSLEDPHKIVIIHP